MLASDPSGTQKVARYILIAVLVALGVWMLRRFLPALCWAVVLAIATSGLYDRWLARFRGKRRDVWAAATFTTFVGVVLIVPLIYAAALALSEAISLTRSFIESARTGPPVLPGWLGQIPGVEDWIRTAWEDAFSGAGPESALTHARPRLFEWTRLVGLQLERRTVTLVFTLLTLFFVCLHRNRLREDVLRAAQRLFGHAVDRLLHRAVLAIQATVDGIVLVAVAEGALMGAVYALAGVGHPVLLGTVTGVFAMVPFAAPVVFGLVAVVLAAQGSLASAIAVAAAGMVVLFVADHFVRPAIIGGAARLPFLWVLLGILGGIESFGLLGIFLGPALMAALVAIWQGSVAEMPPPEGGGGASDP
ncbi:MAG TPA: AI-2E family transporter [Steroidobacteraceae bacterium]|nr:AI-2E family transporter [Steroidobacteraceae bacterium]